MSSGLSLHPAYLEDIAYIRDQSLKGLIGDFHYNLPLRPKITFMNRAETETYYTYDPFITNNNINVIYTDTDNGVGETGSANILVEDSSKAINQDLISEGTKVKIQIAKTQPEYLEDWSYFLVGYVREFEVIRPATGLLEYEIQINGTKIIFDERQVNMKKETDPTSNNPKFFLKNMIRSLIEKKESYPLKRPTLQQQIATLTTDGISEELDTFISSVNFEIISAAAAMDNFVNIGGARWFIDHFGGKENLTVSFPTDFHSGVTIKSADLVNYNTDSSVTTSKFGPGSWSARRSINQFTGFSNRLISTTQIDNKQVFGNFVNNGSTSLANKAISQKFQILETRITDLDFILSKVGNPTSPKDRVNGRLIADNNGKPTGPTLATFEIPLGDIDKEPDTIFVNDIDIKEKLVTPGMFAHAVLYQRSAFSGDPNPSETDTIRWHHNNNITSVITTPSLIAAGGDRDNPNLVWNYSVASDKGPIYAFGVFAKVRHLQEASDRQSIAKFGLIETPVDTSFLEDANLINIYLHSLLQYTSRPRIVFNVNAVKCPDYFLFKPYQVVTIQDSKAYPGGIDAEIQRVRYVFDATNNNNFGIGARYCEIAPVGFHDFKAPLFRCG